MKLLPWPEATSEEFEGRTFDEALQLARRELGSEAAIRCWRVRRGGVFGFFARESFVAGLTAPEGAEPSHLRSGRGEQSAPEALSHLDDLVEATTDEVRLGSDLALDSDFSKVLAEAEAALVDAVAMEQTPAPAPSVQLINIPVEEVEGLSASLAALGVPSDYLPETQTLDALVRSLATLPTAAPMAANSLVVVVGSRREALATAGHVVVNLGLAASDLIVGERTTSLRARVLRRRSGKKMTVLVVEASLRSRDLDQVATWIDQLEPDYVLGAVPATAKRADFERWHAQLGRIDALALSRLASTTSLAELMGALPIALLDGAPASTLRWVALLLNSKLEGER